MTNPAYDFSLLKAKRLTAAELSPKLNVPKSTLSRWITIGRAPLHLHGDLDRIIAEASAGRGRLPSGFYAAQPRNSRILRLPLTKHDLDERGLSPGELALRSGLSATSIRYWLAIGSYPERYNAQILNALFEHAIATHYVPPLRDDWYVNGVLDLNRMPKDARAAMARGAYNGQFYQHR